MHIESGANEFNPHRETPTTKCINELKSEKLLKEFDFWFSERTVVQLALFAAEALAFFCVQLPSSANERHFPFSIHFAELSLRIPFPLKLYLRLWGCEKLLHNVCQMPWMQRRNWNRRLFCETTKTERCIEHCVDHFHSQMSKWFGPLVLRSQANSEFNPFSIFGHHLHTEHTQRAVYWSVKFEMNKEQIRGFRDSASIRSCSAIWKQKMREKSYEQFAFCCLSEKSEIQLQSSAFFVLLDPGNNCVDRSICGHCKTVWNGSQTMEHIMEYIPLPAN